MGITPVGGIVDQDYTYQEGNVLISVVIKDSQAEPTIRIGNEELSVAQWHRLYSKVNDLVFNLVLESNK